jgi:16S rRNA (cytosine967-C5)-methyltransferase
VNQKEPARHSDPLAARRAAMRVLLSVKPGLLDFDVAFDREASRRPLPRKDRALARALAAGSMKLRRRLDHMLEQIVEERHRPLPQAIQQILRIGVFQLTELERVPKHAAVSTAVDMAKQWGHLGTARLVNAVLRKVADHDTNWAWPDRREDPVKYLASYYSYPNWMVRRWITDYGEETAEEFCRLGNRSPGVTLRLNSLTADRSAITSQLTRMARSSEPGRWFDQYLFLPDPPPIEDLRFLHSGFATVQNEAAALAVSLLDLKPGEAVVEVGAAPGGKATHAAEIVGHSGRVIALDVNNRRAQRLIENAARMGLNWIQLILADGRALPITRATKILVEAPCSSLGVLHRHPDLRWQKDISDIPRLAQLQYELLNSAVDASQPQGRIVYSTCTTSREENEAVIARLLQSREDVTVVDPRPFVPDGVPASAQWISLHPDPPQIDGAFACCLERRY